MASTEAGRLVVLIAIAAVATSCSGARSSTSGASSAQAAEGSIVVTSDHGLYRRSPDGKLRRLTTGARDSFPAWSRDGTRIAFERHDVPAFRCELFVVKSDGSGLHRVGRVETDCSGASWGPSDRQLVFGGGPADANNATLWVVNADGSRARRLLFGRGANLEGTHPAWSPDGRTIAFGWTASRLGGLLAIRPDGAGLHALVKPRHGHVDAFTQPAWSPDGRRVAFVHVDLGAGARRVMVASAQGEARRSLARLPYNPGEQGVPSWSPDGRLIAFSGFCGHLGCVWTVPAQGGKRRVLLRGRFLQASWGPAGT